MSPLLILIIAFLSVFLLIMILRIIITLLLKKSYKRRKRLDKIIAEALLQRAKNFPKEDEDLYREKLEIPKGHPKVHSASKVQNKVDLAEKSGSYEVIRSIEDRMLKEELSKIEIVDFVKPIGFWTSMILGQKLSYLIQSAKILKEKQEKGFWVSMIEAKDRQAGKQHSRGR